MDIKDIENIDDLVNSLVKSFKSQAEPSPEIGKAVAQLLQAKAQISISVNPIPATAYGANKGFGSTVFKDRSPN